MIILNGLEVQFESFPNGETKLLQETVWASAMGNIIDFKYEEDGDLIKLMFVKKFVDGFGYPTRLTIEYMPYSRMDRSENKSPFTLKYISEFINNLNFDRVKVIEPHSDVTPALLDRSESLYINFDLLEKVCKEIGFDKEIDYLFFPDAGAQKRYHSLKGYKQLVGYKNRNFLTGDITDLEVVGKIPELPGGRQILIVDDLSSKGTTFLHSGRALKHLGFAKVHLLVAHCENAIFDGELLRGNSPIDKIFTTDSIIDTTIDHNSGNDYEEKLTIYKLEELI